jgi:single-stranded-DNA-specific exonuclease
VLVRRGLGDAAAARRFLEGTDSHDPLGFRGIERALDSLAAHLRRGSRIAIHGDYDVDGVCSTAIAVRALRGLGADVRARIPSRMEDGYGVSSATVEDLAGRGVNLLVTVDCGIGAVEQVALARELGMDVIITDHHRPGATLPDCPIVHPALCEYPCPELCATGVAYKLFQALYGALGRDPAELEPELELVALATVADVVPLLGENRALVKRGLHALAGTTRPGLRALMQVAGVEPQAVDERSLAFALAPRINAAGRLYRADAGLELLLTDDGDRALKVARELDAVNSERRAVETRILFEAEGQLAADDNHRERYAHVLAGEGWHPGVIGIVASRLVERYHRPCVMIALDEEGRGRGSGRSISAYDLHGGLEACATHLTRFGGHRMAAGLELEASSLAAFRAALVEHAGERLEPHDLTPVERVDAVVPGDALGLALAEELDRLRPFGMGNPGVNLLLPAARVGDVRSMGEGRHARFTARAGGVRTSVVAFGCGGTLPGGAGRGEDGSRQDVVARLESNEWGGAVEPRLVLRSLQPLGAAPGERRSDDGGGCAECSCRARGTRWWDLVWKHFETPLESPPVMPAAAGSDLSRQVIDARGRGIVGVLGDLLSTGESLAVVTADCSRRRGLVESELRPERFGREPAIVISEHCDPGSDDGSSAREGAFALLDYASVGRRTPLLERFTHVFALDPPPLPWLETALRTSTSSSDSFLHLGWGAGEVEFAIRAVEQELGLRGPLAAVYRALSAQPGGGGAAELEPLLAGQGRHPRSPALVGRCLRVLADLALVELERSSATVKCTIVDRGGGREAGSAAPSGSATPAGDSGQRVALERSETFRAFSTLHREALRYLTGKAQPHKKGTAAARAA